MPAMGLSSQEGVLLVHGRGGGNPQMKYDLRLEAQVQAVVAGALYDFYILAD